MNMQTLSVRKVPDSHSHDLEILFTNRGGWFSEDREYTKVYRGGGIVFHELSTGTRAGTHLESWLSDELWFFLNTSKPIDPLVALNQELVEALAYLLEEVCSRQGDPFDGATDTARAALNKAKGEKL